MTEEEQLQLASLYEPGQVLWRAPIHHFCLFDLNWGIGAPGAVGPDGDGAGPGLLAWIAGICPALGTVESSDQVLHEVLPLAGTPMTLNYRSDRVPGCTAGYSTDIPLSGALVPSILKRIDLVVEVAGQVHRSSFPPVANQRTTFIWDGLDPYGRPVQGARRARVRLGYVYDACYLRPPYEMRNFGVLGA